MACLFSLRNARNLGQALFGPCIAGFAWGGCLALMPFFAADCFGARNTGPNRGILFTARGVCGHTVSRRLAGIMQAARDAGGIAGSRTKVYFTPAMMAIIAAVTAFVIKRPMQELSEQHAGSHGKKKGRSLGTAL